MKKQMENYISTLSINELISLIGTTCGCKRTDLIDAIDFKKRLEMIDMMTNEQLDDCKYDMPTIESSVSMCHKLDKEMINECIARVSVYSDDSESDSD